ncbi:MAG: putative porin [Limisphaerales bacterium]
MAAISSVNSNAQSADALIDKLIDKGILTVDEANELRDESDKNFNSAYQVRSGMPDWVTSLKVGGDFRGRFEMFHSEEPTFVDRDRFRYRVRPGIVASIRDNFEVGFRLTSSDPQGSFGGDPISGNTTFQDNASKKFVYIDLAYGKWTAINNADWSLNLTVGKMENPFVFSDMVFDGDYTPEGFAQQFSFNVHEAHQLKLNLGQFVLDEISTDSDDPYMFGAQVRLDSTWNQHIATSLGLGALAITADENLRETPAGAPVATPVLDAGGNQIGTVNLPGSTASSQVPNVNSGNTRTSGFLANNFNPLVADAAFTYTLESFPRYNSPFPIRFAAEYMNNPAADEHNEGYSFGVTFGKAGKKGLWELGYRWKHLEADAWYEEVVDSDFGGLRPSSASARAAYAPGTNVEGHIIKAAYSPFDSLTINLTYFLAELIANTPAGFDEDIGRLQLDAIWKF